MDKEKLLISAILFNHNVPINEAKIIGAHIENLKQQNRKQKEMIDKAVEYINQHWVIDDPVWFKNDLLDILKGGNNNER